jgi:hypothetical protein
VVFLAFTLGGYESYRSLGPGTGSLWLAAGVVSDEELLVLRAEGIDVSVFNYTIESHEAEVISGAVETIREHHPSEAIWVEP